MFKILVAEKEKNLKFKSPIFFVAQPVSVFLFCFVSIKSYFFIFEAPFSSTFFSKSFFFYIFYSRWRFRFQSLGTEAALSDWLGPWNRKKEKQQQQWSRRRFETETERHNGLITRRHSNINSMKTCKLVDSKTRAFLQNYFVKNVHSEFIFKSLWSTCKENKTLATTNKLHKCSVGLAPRQQTRILQQKSQMSGEKIGKTNGYQNDEKWQQLWIKEQISETRFKPELPSGLNKVVNNGGGGIGTEVAFVLLTQQPRVWF